jgi:acetyl esterase/lipase
VTFDRRNLLGMGLAAGALVASGPAWAARGSTEPLRIPLWPKGAPEPVPAGLSETLSERSKDPAVRDRALRGVIEPRLELFLPKRGNGAAIIAVPGGGYRHMAWDKEGLEIARWFAGRGIAGFALAYRLPHEGWAGGADTPLADAQRAVRLVRANAAAWGIDPGRIAVVGFSAGGHLVTNLAAQSARPVYLEQDAADRLSARPDLVAPIYPAIMVDRLSGALPRGETLFGRPMDAETLARHSPHLHAREDSPPHFLVHAEDDPLVGPEHTLALRAALRAKGIAVDTHLHAKGGHGFGIRHTRGLPLADWPERLIAFGRSIGWIAQ